MHQFRFLMTIILLALALAVPPSLAAQEEPLPEGVTLDFLAFATVAAVPEDADQLVLFRLRLASGASFPITPDQGGVALAEVERGTLTSTVDGPTQVARADAEPGTEEIMPEGETVTLDAGDSALYATGLSGELRNDGSEEVSLLILEALPFEPMADAAEATPVTDAEAEAAMALPEGVAVEFLSAGAVPDLEGGAVFALSRVTYASGVSQPGVPQPGSEISVVEAGVFTITPTEGPPITIVRELGAAMAAGEEPKVEIVGPGQEAKVKAGDGAYFPAGNVTDARNDRNDPATALLGFVFPEEG